jgi:hypothetical protein
MVQINFAQKQVTAKIVYYGPGMSGKTTNLEVIHQRAPAPNRGELTSISTDGDRTLFFDFMPLDLGTVAGMRTCFQIYTVPGQVYYNSTRKLVLQGVDGVVFIADSSASSVQENLESLRNLEENLNEYGKSLATLPHVIQYNKRDLPDALPIEQLNQMLNPHGAPAFEAIASTGQGVFPTLKGLAARVLESIHTTAPQSARPNAPAPARPAAPLPQATPAAAARPGMAGSAQLQRTQFQSAAAPGLPQVAGPMGGGAFGQPMPGMPGHMPAPMPAYPTPGQSHAPAMGTMPPAGTFGVRPGSYPTPAAAAPGSMPGGVAAVGAVGGAYPTPSANSVFQTPSQPPPYLNTPPPSAAAPSGGLNLAARMPTPAAPRPARGATAPQALAQPTGRSAPSQLEGTRFKPRQAPRPEVKATPAGKPKSNPIVIGVLAVVGVGAVVAIILTLL